MKTLSQKIGMLFVTLINFEAFAQADWKIVGENENVKSGKSYYLQVASNSKFLKYEDRDDPGINLGWGKTDKPYFQFIKVGGGEIKNGDKIAVYVGDQTGPKKYLKYEKRDKGINLSWSSTPVYEWELRDLENETGNSIKTNTTIGIVNNVERNREGDFMVYCRRRFSRTVNLAWNLDCIDGERWPGKLNDSKIREVASLAINHRGKLYPLLDAVPLD